MTNLGSAYARGLGVTADYNEARRWYEKAAEAGDPMGMSNLAYLYYKGQGVVPDPERAFYLYQRAAQLGEPSALLEYGGFFVDGNGVEKNVAIGFELIRRAAMSGLVDAAVTLAKFYRDGHGVARDDVEALTWFIVAVERKLPEDERIPLDLVSARDALKERLSEQQKNVAAARAEEILRKIGGRSKTG